MPGIGVAIPLSWLIAPVVALGVYWECLKGGPIFDDNAVLPEVGLFRWTEADLRIQPRLLTTVTLWCQAQWPNTMRGLHVGNGVIHAAVALVVERIALDLGLSPALALVAALFTAVHPFAVNTVGYISGRASLLTALFGGLAIWAALVGYPVLAFPALALAALSKPDGAAYGLPVGLLVPHAWVLALLILAVAVAFRHRRELQWYRTSAGTGDQTMRELGLPGSLPQPQHGWTVAVETLWRIPAWFMGRGNSPYYGSGIPVPGFSKALGASLVLAGLAFVARIFPIPVLLILGGPWLVYILVPVPDQLMDYRNYGMVPGFALLLTSLLGRLPFSLGLVLGLLIVGAAAFITFDSAKTWASPQAMWAAAIQKTWGDPARAWAEAGAYHKLDGHAEDAERCLRQAVALNPRMGPALNNLAWVVAAKGDPAEGIRLLEQCMERCPRYVPGWHDLGVFYHKEGRLAEAKAALRHAVELDGRMERSVNRLGMVAFDEGQVETACEWFDRAVQMRPNHFEYIYNHAVALRHAGDSRAAAEFQRLPVPLPITRDMIPVEFAK